MNRSFPSITEHAEVSIVSASGVRHGLLQLQSLHTTTALFVNEWQDALVKDLSLLDADLDFRREFLAVAVFGEKGSGVSWITLDDLREERLR